MSATLPAVDHLYKNRILDSTRWNAYTPRDDDIVIATPYKSGTTWTQIIVMNLIFQDLQLRPVWELSPWLELDAGPVQEVTDKLEQQAHRRFIKTHLPLDGLPYLAQVKYIFVGRDARDVFMSMWNHYSNFVDKVYEDLNQKPDRVDELFPRCPVDIRDFWQGWITRGWFEWESEGYPFWSNMHHTQTWWDFKHLPNILCVHYNDLLSHLEGEIQRIADFLGIEIRDGLLPKIAEAVTFVNVKQNAEQMLPGIDETFKGGSQTFINKGTNGRWRDILTHEDLELYHAAVARELTPDCAQWLENGRLKIE